MNSFDDVLSAQRAGDDDFDHVVPPGFGQGKATFGGLVLGALTRAMTARCDMPSRPLRSLQAQLVGAPVPGPATIHTRVLRTTGTTITVAAELMQGGSLCTHAVGIFADARAVDVQWQHLHLPTQLPDWRSVDAMDEGNPFAPEFTRNFEFRPIHGIPFTADAPDTSGFIRPRAPCTVLDDALLVCIIDAWWLAAFIGFDGFRPAATMTFSAELHGRIEHLDAPLYHRGVSIRLHDGYSTETRELWSLDGRLLATNRQLVTVIK
jgi:acyl-CoA thioesterase